MVKIQSHEVSTPNYDQHILSITCERNEMKCWTRCNTFCSSSAPTEYILRHDQLASVVRIKLILLAMTHHTTLHKHSSQCSRSQSLYTCYVQTLANVTYILCVPVLLRSNVGRGFLILAVPRYTHYDAPQPVGLLWTGDQSVAETVAIYCYKQVL